MPQDRGVRRGWLQPCGIGRRERMRFIGFSATVEHTADERLGKLDPKRIEKGVAGLTDVAKLDGCTTAQCKQRGRLVPEFCRFARVDHDDAARIDRTERGLEHLVEIVPVGPIADDHQIAIEQAILQPRGTFLDPRADRIGEHLPCGPDGFRRVGPAAMDLEERGLACR